MKAKYCIIIILFIILFSTGIIGYYYYDLSRKTMPSTHVYIESKEFTDWITDDLKVDWVPTYIIIKNNNVIGKFKGGIDLETFNGLYAVSIVNSENESNNIALPDKEITNINGQISKITDIFNNGTYILEISWLDCKDCKFQDEHYTNDIYKKYGTKYIYRYYIKTELKDLEEKYNVRR